MFLMRRPQDAKSLRTHRLWAWGRRDLHAMSRADLENGELEQFLVFNPRVSAIVVDHGWTPTEAEAHELARLRATYLRSAASAAAA